MPSFRSQERSSATVAEQLSAAADSRRADGDGMFQVPVCSTVNSIMAVAVTANKLRVKGPRGLNGVGQRS